MGFLGLLCIPLSSSLHDFSVRQHMDAEFRRFKSGRAQHFEVVKANSFYGPSSDLHNVRVVDILIGSCPCPKILTRPVFAMCSSVSRPRRLILALMTLNQCQCDS